MTRRTAHRIAAGGSCAALIVLASSCGTPLSSLDLDQPASSSGWSVERDAFGGFYAGPDDGPQRYTPPRRPLTTQELNR